MVEQGGARRAEYALGMFRQVLARFTLWVEHVVIQEFAPRIALGRGQVAQGKERVEQGVVRLPGSPSVHQ